MDFIQIMEESLSIDDADWSEQFLIEKFQILIKSAGFDDLRIACGVNPSPDFGYFQLADRFWRASLAIYFSGVTGCFYERGAGYPEPWLFNARHSIELYLKGCNLYSVWFQELQSDVLSSGDRIHFNDLKKYFKKPHHLYQLYDDYQNLIRSIIKKWNTEELSEPPETGKVLLTQIGEDILKQIDEADGTSFRFRYPSLKKNKTDHLQRINWQYDNSQLLSKTGLPLNSGIFFDHITVINSFHKLIMEIKAMAEYLGGCWSYIDEIQEIGLDLRREFEEFNSE